MIIGLLKGLIVGIIVSIPVGPLGLLCIPRTLARGRRAGLAVGLGGSASDTLYSALALFALSFISSFIDAHKGWVLLAGGLIISITGIRLLVSRRQVRHPDSVTARAVSPVRHIEGALNGFLISVTNPGTLVCMLWLFISTFRDRITIGQLHILTRICGAAILLIGLASAVKSLPLLQSL